ncbi:MAG: hypothetical protein ACPG19_07045 [Saprospiraceae bacterium]
MSNNILDEGEFIKKSLSQHDVSELAFLRESERAYQRKVNQGRNGIFFVIAFHTLFLANLIYFKHSYDLPIYESIVVVLFLKIVVFLVLSFLISKKPKLISGIAFVAVLLDVISQMILEQNGANFFFFTIINAFLARAYEAANRLTIARNRIVSLGEEPTF